MSRSTVLFVGTGGIARMHLRNMMSQRGAPVLGGFVEVDEGQRDRTRARMEELKRPCPPFFERIADFLEAGQLPP